jgi:hypothetical protein
LHKDEIKEKCANYYKLHREEILKKKAIAYSKKKLLQNNLFFGKKKYEFLEY